MSLMEIVEFLHQKCKRLIEDFEITEFSTFYLSTQIIPGGWGRNLHPLLDFSGTEHLLECKLNFVRYGQVDKLRPASRNMVRQCGSESHNHLHPIPYGLVVFA